MKVLLSSIKRYDYANVVALLMRGGGYEVRLELPTRVLDEVGWEPRVSDEVELEVTPEGGSLEEWEVVLSGKLLKAGEGEYTLSCGGLLCTVKGPGASSLAKAYVRLRRVRGASSGEQR